MTLLTLIILFVTLPATAAFNIALNKGRSPAWIFFGLGFGWLGVLIMLFLPKMKQCPKCKDRVKKEALVCGNCYYDFQAAAKK